MQRLTDFIRALRRARIRISPAETLESLAAAECVGYAHRQQFKDALGATLAKSAADKRIFSRVFEAFFHFDTVSATLAEDVAAINRRFVAAGRTARVDQIQVFTQKGLYTNRLLQAMGFDETQQTLHRLEQSTDPAMLRQAEQMREQLAHLRTQARGFVEQQFLLYADSDGSALRENLLRTVNLAHIEKHHLEAIRQLIRRMAQKLKAARSTRARRSKMRQLDVAKTLRYNTRFDNHLFSLKWKTKKPTKPQVFAVCDVSGSVAAYARFMLMFLLALGDVLPKMRAFAFSARLYEVTAELQGQDQPAEAINEVLHRCAGGSTDYGRAFGDFCELALTDLNAQSTLIILGDGRNNGGDARTDLLRRLAERAGRVLWLNPEPESSWGHGDSEIEAYRRHCHQVSVCNSLQHLERIISRLVKVT